MVVLDRELKGKFVSLPETGPEGIPVQIFKSEKEEDRNGRPRLKLFYKLLAPTQSSDAGDVAVEWFYPFAYEGVSADMLEASERALLRIANACGFKGMLDTGILIGKSYRMVTERSQRNPDYVKVTKRLPHQHQEEKRSGLDGNHTPF